MASTIKVDNVQNTPGTNIINKCGATITVGAACNSVAVTGNIVKSNAIQASDGGNIVNQCGTDITLGASGDTINLASGASQSGFGRTGTVDWITTPKVTGDSPVTGVTGKGYFMNTTAGTITINFPAGSAGDIISVMDYAATWNSNNLTVAANGSEKFGGLAGPLTLSTAGQSVTFVYVDGTQGWLNTMDSTSNVRGASFLTATGGAATLTCGNFKTHVFTGPGTFCVSALATSPANDVVQYMVVAGGGGAGRSGGGGGAGGWRGYNACSPASPINAPTTLPVSATGYPIAVGGGGAGGDTDSSVEPDTRGADSTFSSITSTGGGGGANYNAPGGALPGGSGGGGGAGGGSGGTGNTPPFSPAQGTSGGPSQPNLSNRSMGGGGGATVAGTAGSYPNTGGCGGDGTYVPDGWFGPTAPSYGTPGPVGSTRYFAGGGGGAQNTAGCVPGGAGGGGMGAGGPPDPGNRTAGTTNTGGGSGGLNNDNGLTGGSGIVLIRYKYQ